MLQVFISEHVSKFFYINTGKVRTLLCKKTEGQADLLRTDITHSRGLNIGFTGVLKNSSEADVEVYSWAMESILTRKQWSTVIRN